MALAVYEGESPRRVRIARRAFLVKGRAVNMWRCSYLSYFSATGGILVLALAGILAAVLVWLAVRRGRRPSSAEDVHRDRSDSLEILRIRYARGEVDKETYCRMKAMLKRSGK